MENNVEQPKANPAKVSKKKGNKKSLIIAIVTIVVLCAIAGVVAFVIINNNKSNVADGIEGGDSQSQPLTEEEKKQTEDTLKQYAEVTIEGYKDVDNPNTKKAVVVKVKNISKETTSIAVTIGAYDRDGNLLETSSTYAEGLEPDQSVIFDTFVYTELTEDQLNSATFKVFTAKTYTTEGLVEETGEGTEEPAEEQAPAESESTETNENQ